MHDKYGKVALCLAGGGGRGIIQAGQIKAFYDYGIVPDVLFGASVGALNGILYQQGQIPEMVNMWKSIKTSDVYTWNIFRNILSPFTKDGSIFDSSPLASLINKTIDRPKLLNNTRPFYINTTDIRTWKPMSLEVKSLHPDELPVYLKASASPPILFPSVPFRGLDIKSNLDDTILVDGGLVNNFSIMSAIDEGADTIVILSPTVPEPKDPTNLLDMISLLGAIPPYEYLERELKFVDRLNKVSQYSPRLREIKVVNIRPAKPTGIDLLDFEYRGKDRNALLAYGYALAMSTLQKELPI